MRVNEPFHKCSSEGEMGHSIASDARRMVRAAAEPVNPGETVKAQMRRACRALGYEAGNWRVRAAWNGEAGCWSASAFEELKARYQSWRVRQEEKAHVEARNAAAIFDAIAGQLGRVDETFHSEDIASLLSLARRLRGVPDEQMK